MTMAARFVLSGMIAGGSTAFGIASFVCAIWPRAINSSVAMAILFGGLALVATVIAIVREERRKSNNYKT